MPLYLVERYLPPDAEQLTSMVERVARMATTNDATRYRWCLVAPDDAAALCLFEAPDAGAVTDLNRRGAFPFDRITEVTAVRRDG